MIKLGMQGAHTGDILMALPAIGGLLRQGNDVGVICNEPYRRPLSSVPVTWMTHGPGERPRFSGIHHAHAWLKHFGVMPSRLKLYPYGRQIAKDVMPDGKWCVISPWADAAFKRWDIRNWSYVALHALFLGFKVKVIGPSAAASMARDIALAAGADHLTGDAPHTWPALLERASVVITPDTGACHMADALGVPVIGLYGGTKIGSVGPYWDASHCLQAKGMDQIRVNAVLRELESIA